MNRNSKNRGLTTRIIYRHLHKYNCSSPYGLLVVLLAMLIAACDGSSVTVSAADNVEPEVVQQDPTGFPLTQGSNIGVVAITGTDINGTGSDQTRVLPGAQFSVTFNYTIVASPSCLTCIDQIEVGVVTLDGTGSPQACAYSGIAGAQGVTSFGQVLLNAPQTPGTYYIAFDRSQHFSCDQAISSGGFWNGPVSANQFIGSIAVF